MILRTIAAFSAIALLCAYEIGQHWDRGKVQLAFLYPLIAIGFVCSFTAVLSIFFIHETLGSPGGPFPAIILFSVVGVVFLLFSAGAGLIFWPTVGG